MWGECACGHHRNNHPWTGAKYGTCRLCATCGAPGDRHVFVSHQYTRCECAGYREVPE